MTIAELLPLLHQLNRTDKLLVLQFLANELVAEDPEAALFGAKQYEIWSPYDSAEAAHQLMAMLDDDHHE